MWILTMKRWQKELKVSKVMGNFVRAKDGKLDHIQMYSKLSTQIYDLANLYTKRIRKTGL